LPAICFLVATTGTPHNDNAVRLPAAFAARGWTVRTADHDAVRLDCDRLVLEDGTELRAFDRLWILGLGRRSSFLDRMQMLAFLPAEQFVTTPQALLELHGKYALPLGPLAQHHPESYASNDPRRLAALVARGGEWIAKPPGASFGRGVYRLHADDPNLRVVLDALTGHDGSQYALLQRYVPEIERGETRVLVAGGEPIAAYLRQPVADHRANLAADAHAEPIELKGDTRELAQRCAAWLATRGVGFAAVDIAFPWIVEFNVANPGGLGTLARLTGVDYAPAVAAAVEAGVLPDRKAKGS
jgi:glutathione synthase